MSEDKEYKRIIFDSFVENKEEIQYLNLIRNVVQNGTKETGRNGNTLSLFGECMRFSLKDNTIPILTTKKIAWKTCLKELLWFIRGSTNNHELTKEGVHIWDSNSTREFLDSRGLQTYNEGMLGPIYGYQWRNFNADYDPVTGNPNTLQYSTGVDQLQYIIDELKNPSTRNSRRLVMTAWNPCQNNQMSLPPCHVLCQFNVHDGNKLSCALYQRSGDVGLGVPFNIASYSFLTHLLAKHCGLEAFEFVHFLGNCHIYDDHVEQLIQQTNRSTFEFPKLHINAIHENINDYTIQNFLVENYKSHEHIKMYMRP